MHLHLSLHLRLNLGERLRRARHTSVARVTAIFAAFMEALALVLSPVWTRVSPIYPHPLSEALFGLAGDLTFAGALLGVGAVLVALWASFWQVQPPASQSRPHDASPSEGDSSEELRGYSG